MLFGPGVQDKGTSGETLTVGAVAAVNNHGIIGQCIANRPTRTAARANDGSWRRGVSTGDMIGRKEGFWQCVEALHCDGDRDKRMVVQSWWWWSSS